MPSFRVSFIWLVLICALGITTLGNNRFVVNVFQEYPVNFENMGFLLSVFVALFCVNALLVLLISFRFSIKPALVTILLVSSFAAYFMDTYNVIIDDEMIDNIFRTDVNESLNLLSSTQFFYLLFLGVIPAWLILRANIEFGTPFSSVVKRLSLFVGITIILAGTLLWNGNAFAAFFREHKVLRYYTNPANYIYSTAKYLDGIYETGLTEFKQIGLDAQLPLSDSRQRLVVFVVGETVRTDHLFLNGYIRDTTPLLSEMDLVSFDNFWACGTSTAVSVPCMFASHDKSSHSRSLAYNSENVLDVLQRAGVAVSWHDNNSDSKGVALRVPNESYRGDSNNPVCDIECRDVGMLANLGNFVDEQMPGNTLLIMHQMGNHGPAYYKRYPSYFEKFSPACKSNLLERCSKQEIVNAYDNALLYTDYFLAQLIAWLKTNYGGYETALIYVSDHGESLGENNLYLHGLPYALAPKEQKQAPALIWLGKNWPDRDRIMRELNLIRHDEFSHDNISHTLLGIFDVDTSIYIKAKDLIPD